MSDQRSDSQRLPLAAARDDSSAGVPHTEVAGGAGMTYRPILELGEGGMARVFLAHAAGPSGFTKLVVLKMMRRQRALDPDQRALFQAEARLSARLNHPNLVQVYEVSQTDNVPCLVMEYLDGKPLSALHAVEGLNIRMRLTILCEALSGLHHAHELKGFDGKPLGIVHRDISPHNLFVTYNGGVKLLDFGIAKTATANNETKTGEIKGKLTYMAPEQLLGEAIDRRADIFAMGSMLWDAVLGTRMWDGVSEGVLMQRLVTGDIPRPGERGTIDPILEAMIVKATAPKPEDRYATALELQHDLDEFLTLCGGRVPVREIGTTLAEVFAEERQESALAISRALQQSLPPAATPMAVEAPPAPRKSPMPALIAAAVLFLGGFAAFRLGVFEPKAEPAPTRAAQDSTIVVKLDSQPEDARVELDGKHVGGAHVALRVPKDGQEHVIKISAPDHATETRVVRFDRSRSLQIGLRKLAPEPEPEQEVEATSDVEPAERAAPRGRRPRVVTRPSPAPKAPTSAAPPVAPQPAPVAEDKCSPPYYFENGIKTYKPECL